MNFFNEIYARFKLPWKYGAFNAYFIIIVVIFGGVGIWASIHDVCLDKGECSYRIAQNIGTYFMAIIAASIVDLNLSLTIKNFASLNIYSTATIAFAFFLFYLSYSTSSNYAFIPAIIGFILGLVIWILANADNEKLNDNNYYKKMVDKSKSLTQNWENEQ